MELEVQMQANLQISVTFRVLRVYRENGIVNDDDSQSDVCDQAVYLKLGVHLQRPDADSIKPRFEFQ